MFCKIHARLLCENLTSIALCLSQAGSPSALSDCDLNQKLRQAAQESGRTLYVPSGALWGGQDIQRLNDSGGLKVTIAWVALYEDELQETIELLYSSRHNVRTSFTSLVSRVCS